MKTCYFTGLCPQEFPFDHTDESAHAHILYTNALYQKAEELIRRGYTAFVTGLSPGAELDFACAVIYHKNETFRDILNITLEGMLSASGPKPEWPDKYFNQYEYVLSNCDRAFVRQQIRGAQDQSRRANSRRLERRGNGRSMGQHPLRETKRKTG